MLRAVKRAFCIAATVFLVAISLPNLTKVAVQDTGEAIVTSFPGTLGEFGQPVISRDGGVAHLVDFRNPGLPPSGARLDGISKRMLVTAEEVGLVFGIAVDDAQLPDIYLAASAAFGLHLNSNGDDWMDGMWGRGGGPGSVWRLVGADGHAPEG